MQPVPEGVSSARRFAQTDEFLRRVHPTQLNPDGSVSTAAFTDYSMSVNWAKLSSVDETLRGWDGYGVVSITAGLCWRLEQQIGYTPVEESPDIPVNRAHCEVIGKKTQRVRKEFKNGAKWIRWPER